MRASNSANVVAAQSGFEPSFKAHFLGSSYYLPGVAGNNMLLTNVPDIRLLFRHESLEAERALVCRRP